jgi:hypothetical protein
MVTSKAEEYAKALECEERAEQTRDPFIKQLPAKTLSPGLRTPFLFG